MTTPGNRSEPKPNPNPTPTPTPNMREHTGHHAHAAAQNAYHPSPHTATFGSPSPAGKLGVSLDKTGDAHAQSTSGSGSVSSGAPNLTGGTSPTPEALRKAAFVLHSLGEPWNAQLLAHLDRETVDALRQELSVLSHGGEIPAEERDAVLEEFCALGGKRSRFGFEDIARLDDSDITESYRDEDAAIWVLALAGASRNVSGKILTALPRASSESLRHALVRLGPYRLDDAEAAQAEVARRFRRLHDLGRLTLPDPSGQEAILA